jgi:2'-5' RNA ligase
VKRAIHLFPDFVLGSDVHKVRERYDPLADKIPPHITLVFPFTDEISDDDLSAHVRSVARKYGRFKISFESMDLIDSNRLWLIVDEENDLISRIHDDLYSGCLSRHLLPGMPYRPHVTLGVLPEAERAGFWEEMGGFSLEQEYEIERLVIERISPDGHSILIDTVELTGT